MKKLVTALMLPLASMSVQADVLFTEYVEKGNDKALEISNLGSTAVDLGAENYTLELYSNGSTTANTYNGGPIALTGTIEPGASFVITYNNSKTAQEIKDKADLLSNYIGFNGDDAVVLKKGTAVVDSFGKVGERTVWAANGVESENQTLRRQAGASADIIIDDIFDPSATWVANDTFTADGLGCSGIAACEGGVTPPPVVAYECPTELTAIPAIQGDGYKSPMLTSEFEGPEVTIEGTVTKLAKFPSKGFYVQTAAGDSDPATSDGILIYVNKKDIPSTIKEGAKICVTGTIKENYGETSIDISNDTSKFVVIEENSSESITPVQLTFDPAMPLADQLEKHEGMLVSTTDSNLVVTRNFGFDFSSYRSNMVLSLGKPLHKPTQKFAALSDQAKNLANANKLNQIVVETESKPDDGVIPYFNDFNAEDGYILVGDKVQNLEGVLGYSYNYFRLIAATSAQLDKADFVHPENTRTEAPTLPQTDDLRVASFNVLNYFNSSIGGDSNPTNSNRGATTEADFLKQKTKIVNAISKMDSDIIGLMEIENNGFAAGSAIQDLVTAINAAFPNTDDHYTFVASADNGPIGTDAITVGLLYRAAVVKQVGAVEIIKMPTQSSSIEVVESKAVSTKNINKSQRDSILQKFEVIADTDAKGEQLSIVVNHLKSKGSQCFNDFNEYEKPVALYKGKIDKYAKHVAGWEDDLQGSCNEFRVSAVKALGDYLKANVAGDLLVLGDINAYGKEDPIRLLTDYKYVAGERQLVTAPFTFMGDVELTGTTGEALTEGYGYVNLAEKLHGTDAFSYTFDGELGSLDHVLASAGLVEKVAALTDWHINSIENSLFEYNPEHSGALAKTDAAFSSSDHDPVIISLDYPEVVDPVDPIDEDEDENGGGAFNFLWLGALLMFRRKRSV